jgi:hypothetical protein
LTEPSTLRDRLGEALQVEPLKTSKATMKDAQGIPASGLAEIAFLQQERFARRCRRASNTDVRDGAANCRR